MNHDDTTTMLNHVGQRIATGLDVPQAITFLASLQYSLAPAQRGDLSKAWPTFALALITDSTYGVLQARHARGYGRRAIQAVATLLLRVLDSDTVTISERDAVIVATRQPQASSEGASIHSNDANYAAGACCYVEHVDACCYIAACEYAAHAYRYMAGSDYDMKRCEAHWAWQASTLLNAVAGC